jgi:hypothetical protein
VTGIAWSLHKYLDRVDWDYAKDVPESSLPGRIEIAAFPTQPRLTFAGAAIKGV